MKSCHVPSAEREASKVLHDGADTSLEKWDLGDLGRFYVLHRAELLSYAQRLLGDRSKAEEVVQDALIRVLLAAPILETEIHALAYFRKTLSNLCIDIRRVEGRRPYMVTIDEKLSESQDLIIEDENLVDLIAAADDAAIVRQAISLLSPAERSALVMQEIEGFSRQEISKELGIPEHLVRHTVSRAKKSLKRILSEYVVNEQTGTTAIELLSNSYKKSVALAKKSSKAALSIMLLLVVLLGFKGINPMSVNKETNTSGLAQSGSSDVEEPPSTSLGDKTTITRSSNVKINQPAKDASLSSRSNLKSSILNFPGLDTSGVPIGYTVTDSSGAMGSLFVSSRASSFSEDGLKLSWISKTVSGAANILLTETLSQSPPGTSLDVFLSYSRQGRWLPLETQVGSIETERLPSGSYMVTAVILVKSEIESPIAVPATTSGKDLDAPPIRVITRILLDGTKSNVLAQAVQVVERSKK